MSLSISVVIPTYNRAHTLGRALDSVYTQKLKPTEIIVVDDGSTDESLDLLKTSYSGVTVLTQAHSGVSRARNLGITHAKTDWIAFLDSDDEWTPDKLELQAQIIKSEKNNTLIHSDEKWIRNGAPLKQLAKHKKRGGHIYKHCLPLCVISPSSAMIHKSIFEKVGLFDEAFPVCEDYDLWLRICSRFPVLYTDEPLTIKHGGHHDQLSHQYWGMDRFRIMAIARILKESILNPEDYEASIQILIEKIDIYLKGAKKHGNSTHVREFTLLRAQYEC